MCNYPVNGIRKKLRIEQHTKNANTNCVMSSWELHEITNFLKSMRKECYVEINLKKFLTAKQHPCHLSVWVREGHAFSTVRICKEIWIAKHHYRQLSGFSWGNNSKVSPLKVSPLKGEPIVGSPRILSYNLDMQDRKDSVNEASL